MPYSIKIDTLTMNGYNTTQQPSTQKPKQNDRLLQLGFQKKRIQACSILNNAENIALYPEFS